MEFLVAANEYLITYIVEGYTNKVVVYATSERQARGKFNMSKGSLFKITNVVEA